jgi:glycerol uptake facilitator-like aquaporin
MHLFSLSVVAFDHPDIKFGVIAVTSTFLFVIIFKNLDFETPEENKHAYQFFLGIAVTSSLVASEGWMGLEGNAALRLGVFLTTAAAGRLIITRRV